MYIVEDRETPAVQGFLNSLKTKNIWKEHFPTTTSGAHLVYDRLIYYQGSVNKSASALKIYSLLNIKVSDLEAESYEGVDSCWFYLKRINETFIMPADGLETYINDESVLDEWIDVSLSYNPASIDISPGITDAEIITKVLAANPDVWFSVEDDHSLTSVALLDSAGIVFERRAVVTGRSIETKTTEQSTTYLDPTAPVSKYLDSANILFSFRRIIDATDASVATFLSSVEYRISNLDDLSGLPGAKTITYPGTLTDTVILDTTTHTSINEQLLAIYEFMVPATETDLCTTDGKIKVAGMNALTGPEFSKILSKQLTTGFKKKPVSKWKKAISVVITIIVIVIAIYSGGTAAAGLSGMQAAMAFSSAAAGALTAGMMIQAGLALAFQMIGDRGLAMSMAGSMQTLGTISTALGVFNIVGSLVSKAATEGVKEAAKKSIFESIKDAAIDTATGIYRKALSNITTMVLKVMTFAFDMYRTYIAPADEGIADLQKELAETEAMIDEIEEDFSSPSNMRKAQMVVDSPHANPYDMNEYMQNIPYMLTQGKIVGSTTKYYN